MTRPKLAVITHEPAVSTRPVITVALFGRDATGKAHAAWFLEPDAEAARRAADTMDLKLAEISGDAAFAIARQLPAGKVYPSGKAFVPFVKGTLYAELLAAIGEEDEKPEETNPEEEHEKLSQTLYDFSGYRLPPGWGEIKLGSLVLATVGIQEGWYESLVTEVKDEGLFVLRWRDWPDEPPFLRRAHQLGLLPKAATFAA